MLRIMIGICLTFASFSAWATTECTFGCIYEYSVSKGSRRTYEESCTPAGGRWANGGDACLDYGHSWKLKVIQCKPPYEGGRIYDVTWDCIYTGREIRSYEFVVTSFDQARALQERECRQLETNLHQSVRRTEIKCRNY